MGSEMCIRDRHAGYVDGKAGRMQVELLPFDRPHECGARITEVE